MEIVFQIVAVLGILFMGRAIILLPNVTAQIAADGTKGFWNQIKAALFYLYKVEKMKKIFIRDGKFTDKPVHLVPDSKSKLPDNDN